MPMDDKALEHYFAAIGVLCSMYTLVCYLVPALAEGRGKHLVAWSRAWRATTCAIRLGWLQHWHIYRQAKRGYNDVEVNQQ